MAGAAAQSVSKPGYFLTGNVHLVVEALLWLALGVFVVFAWLAAESWPSDEKEVKVRGTRADTVRNLAMFASALVVVIGGLLGLQQFLVKAKTDARALELKAQAVLINEVVSTLLKHECWTVVTNAFLLLSPEGRPQETGVVELSDSASGGPVQLTAYDMRAIVQQAQNSTTVVPDLAARRNLTNLYNVSDATVFATLLLETVHLVAMAAENVSRVAEARNSTEWNVLRVELLLMSSKLQRFSYAISRWGNAFSGILLRQCTNQQIEHLPTFFLLLKLNWPYRTALV